MELSSAHVGGLKRRDPGESGDGQLGGGLSWPRILSRRRQLVQQGAAAGEFVVAQRSEHDVTRIVD